MREWKILRLLRARRSFSGPPKARLVVLEYGNPAFLQALDLVSEKYTQLTSGYDHLYLGVGVLFRCVRGLLKRRRFTQKDLGVVYLSACLRHIGARVVVTFIDNAILFYYLAAECPEIRFVVVQNGMRDEFDADFSGDALIVPATYFCFGDYDVSLRARSALRIATTTPVGSVLDSYHQAARRPEAHAHPYDLCLVSQFRPASLPGDGSPVGPIHPYFASLHVLIGYMKSFCEESGLTICVAGASVDDGREKALYQSAFGRHVPFVFREPFSSYDTMHRSHVVVGVGSTCLFEAFARGKKTLFCAFYDGRQVQPLPENEIWLLQGTQVSYEQFKERLLAILAMDARDYAERSRSAASYFMHYDVHRPAHEVVKAHLRSVL